MVYYEWDIEIVSKNEYADIQDHIFCTSYKDLQAKIKEYGDITDCDFTLDSVLVRTDDNGRSWAYLQDNKTLPEYFEDAYNNATNRVPQRFIKETNG